MIARPTCHAACHFVSTVILDKVNPIRVEPIHLPRIAPLADVWFSHHQHQLNHTKRNQAVYLCAGRRKAIKPTLAHSGSPASLQLAVIKYNSIYVSLLTAI
mmetsp:Transcript_11456/g.18168  ORF Transcript_11456/g.18168 Transcript_11456/m.18168 type:complete len:101 (-) Transcript_11456:427-729(-)